MKNSFEEIYDIVRRIPSGRVSTYGQVARLAGNPRWARVVGYALSVCRDSSVPCHRVVNRRGELCDAFEPLGKDSQRLLLELEGLEFDRDGLIDMEKYMWYG